MRFDRHLSYEYEQSIAQGKNSLFNVIISRKKLFDGNERSILR